MRFGLIGAGRIGRIHGGNVAAGKDCTLAYIADAMPEAAAALAKDTGAKVAEIAAIVGAKDVDAVLICAPADTHAAPIEQCAKAGKAVFCEKPVDLSSQRIRACLKAVDAAKIPPMIGFNRRFDPNFAALKARLDAGAAGAIEIILIISRDPAPLPASYIARSGGLFRDMMVHDLDMARFLLNGEEPVSVMAMGSALVDAAIGAEGDVDTATVMLQTASGRIVQISNSRRATYGYDQRIEVHGALGMIRPHKIPETTVEIATGAGFQADPVQNFFLERYASAYRLELAAFVTAVSSGIAASPNGHDGLRAQMLADAATLAWQSRARVDVA